MKTIFFVLLLLLLSATPSIAEQSSDTYVASPVIFIHGFGAGNWEGWGAGRNALKSYFIDGKKQELKYDYINLDKAHIPYFPFPYLEYPGNSGVDDVTNKYLLPVIEETLKVLPDCPSTEKKVILVAHSMGGLIVRNFIKKHPQYAANVIKRVIFVGTPHQGSPLADFSYILSSIYHSDELASLIKTQEKKSVDIGIPFSVRAKTGSDSDIQHAIIANQNLVKQLEDFTFTLGALNLALNIEGINPNGKAIEHLMLSKHDVSFQRMFQGLDKESGLMTAPVYVPSKRYVVEGCKTFLGLNNLPMPSQERTSIITSQKPATKTKEEKFLDWTSGLKLGFHFPLEENLDSVKTSGDGIVSVQSQSNGQGYRPESKCVSYR